MIDGAASSALRREQPGVFAMIVLGFFCFFNSKTFSLNAAVRIAHGPLSRTMGEMLCHFVR